jgi:uncharacterized repeat protein (TIGR03803 family)
MKDLFESQKEISVRRKQMTDPVQRRNGIPTICQRTATAALALAAMLLLAAVTTQSAQAGTLKTLHNFTGAKDGGLPFAPLVRDQAGNLYGTTESGGTSGAGTVFKITKTGKEIVLYNFTGGADGSNPFVGLVRDTAGNLYGTTAGGGASGQGTVFMVSSAGKESVLHSFAGGTTDGCGPFGGLLRDRRGNLYGTTETCGASGLGTVFKLSKTGQETILHNFAGGTSDGEFPNFTTLLMDKSGTVYGVAEQGGASNQGVVYKLSKSGKFTILHSFAGGTNDGCNIFGDPAMDSAGNIYGTANSCGTGHVGIVWKVSPKGEETVLHQFAGSATDGAEPVAGVIMDAKGNLYGDTYQGGPANLGTVYKLSKKGAFTLLHTFSGRDGSYLYSGVVRDAGGNLYGTALHGGTGQNCQNGCGTVWRITK